MGAAVTFIVYSSHGCPAKLVLSRSPKAAMATAFAISTDVPSLPSGTLKHDKDPVIDEERMGEEEDRCTEPDEISVNADPGRAPLSK
jgi:hypothetical protein